MPEARATSTNWGPEPKALAALEGADFAAGFGGDFWGPATLAKNATRRRRKKAGVFARSRHEFITRCGRWPFLRIAAATSSIPRSVAVLLGPRPGCRTSPEFAPTGNADWGPAGSVR